MSLKTFVCSGWAFSFLVVAIFVGAVIVPNPKYQLICTDSAGDLVWATTHQYYEMKQGPAPDGMIVWVYDVPVVRADDIPRGGAHIQRADETCKTLQSL